MESPVLCKPNTTFPQDYYGHIEQKGLHLLTCLISDYEMAG